MNTSARWDTVELDGERVLVRRSRGVIDGISFSWKGRTVRCEASEDFNASGTRSDTIWRMVDGPALAPWIPGTVAPAVEDLVRWITTRLVAKHGVSPVFDEPESDLPEFALERMGRPAAEVRMINALKIVLTPRETLPSPDDAARRLATLAERLSAFMRVPATWAAESRGRFSLTVESETASVSEESADAFLAEFHSEANQLGFKSARGVALG